MYAIPPGGKSIRSQRAIHGVAGSSSTSCENSAPVLVLLELPDERVPVDPRRAEERLVAPDVVDDAVAGGGLDPARMVVEGEPQWKYWPPSITMVWPVTKSEYGPAR